jgi:hypothetical protein
LNTGRIYAPDVRDMKYGVTEAFIREQADSLAKKDRTAWKIGAITDQGNESSCVGHAWSGSLRAAPIMERKGRDLPSPFKIYKGAQDNDEWPGNNYEGTSVRGGAKYLRKVGLLKSYHWIYSMDVLVETLNNVGPVVIGIDWFEGMFRTRGGFVSPTGKWAGGHAFYVNDYTPVRDAFSCLNSWGAEWGEKGRFFIDRKDMNYLVFGLSGEACCGVEA